MALVFVRGDCSTSVGSGTGHSGCSRCGRAVNGMDASARICRAACEEIWAVEATKAARSFESRLQHYRHLRLLMFFNQSRAIELLGPTFTRGARRCECAGVGRNVSGHVQPRNYLQSEL